MLLIIGMLLMGIVVGRLLMGKIKKIPFSLVLIISCALLFVIGIGIGRDEEIVSYLPDVFFISVILFICGTGCCLLLIKLLTNWMDKGDPRDKKGDL